VAKSGWNLFLFLVLYIPSSPVDIQNLYERMAQDPIPPGVPYAYSSLPTEM
jgi:hypothetical protein